MPAAHQIATEGATKAQSLAADMALRAHQLHARIASAGADFNLSEALSAAIRVTLGLYGVALLVNFAFAY
jgi:hypothetical protein